MIYNFFTFLVTFSLLLTTVYSYSVEEGIDRGIPEDVSAEGLKEETTPDFLGYPRGTSFIRGLNWADVRDNYNAGCVIPTGLLSSDSYASVSEKASKILGGFKTAGANAVRLPINPPSVLESWWNSYKAAVDRARTMGMYVILGCWTENHQTGTVTDLHQFNAMWDKVIREYGSNNGVFFEILNEPFGYSYTAWTNVAATWLARYPSIPRRRVLISGTGYSGLVNQIGGDSRFNGCLLAQHLYAFWLSHKTDSEWENELQARIGSHASRTVVTEYGAPMTPGYNYNGPIDNNNYIAFMYGVPNKIRSSSMGSCYWPGVRDNDSYRLLDINGDRANPSSWYITTTSQTGQSRVRWAWGY